jgi:serine/threonine-protein kinase
VDDPFLERLRRGLAPDFEIEQELGSGGQARVFLAREVALHRQVAIKTIKPELATAVAVERFLREAQTLAGLAHPNIVPIHRLGTTPDGIAYIVMESHGRDARRSRPARAVAARRGRAHRA